MNCRDFTVASQARCVVAGRPIGRGSNLMTKNSMTKTMQILGMAALLMTGAATVTAQGDAGGVSSKAVTGTQTGSQQTNNPATGTALGATSNQTAPTYPATEGPTGSTQPGATNPARSSPAGGGKN
jgi:hypothetical protein